MKNRNKKIQISLNLLFIIVCAVALFPLLLLVSVSISNEGDIAKYGYALIPRRIDFSAYSFILKNPWSVINAYKVTIVFSVIAMLMGVFFMSMIAYPLSKQGFKGKNFVSFYLFFTMLFSGGLVPTYILITQYLHLGDTLWVYILPALISPWYVFMMRTFFQSIPGEIGEAVLIDGGNEYIIFFRIILPLSKPVLATVALLLFLSKWNDWYTAMLYINDDRLVSLQYFLQRTLDNIEFIRNADFANKEQLAEINEIPSESVRMAMAIVVAGPALFVFPFFQKYFVKGLTVGSVKG